MKTIMFNDITYSLDWFKYRNGRQGLILKDLANGEWFAGTVDLEKYQITKDEIIVKTYDRCKGLLDCLIEEGIVSKQTRAIVLGFNHVHLCKLKNGKG